MREYYPPFLSIARERVRARKRGRERVGEIVREKERDERPKCK